MAIDIAGGAAKPLAVPARRTRSGRELIYRHAVLVRVAHWVNVLCLVILFMSGLQIFNAHPRLYWGDKGAEADPAWLSIYAEEQLEGPPIGWFQIGERTFETTGVLGVFRDTDGFFSARAFPWWITIPSYQSLAEGRRWHFFFAWLFALNGLLYLLYGFAAGHFRRNLWPTRFDLRNIGRSLLDHLAFRHPRGEAAKRYNVLQKLAYLGIVFLVLPLMVATGLSMSPGINAAAPWLPELFGGRQSARSVHFIATALILVFVFVHVIQVLLAGPFNAMRSMITGWFAVPPEKIEPKRSTP